MKNGVMLLMSGAIGILLLAVVMTICGNMNYSVELQENLSTAMETSVKHLPGQEEKRSDAKMLSECIEGIILAVDSDMETTVEVYQADAKKGVLALRAIGGYTHLNGMEGDTDWERTVICEKGETQEMEVYEVDFYGSKEELVGGGTCYKSYYVMAGDYITTPAEPRRTGEIFAGWKDCNDYMADFSQPVLQNLCYYAAWE